VTFIIRPIVTSVSSTRRLIGIKMAETAPKRKARQIELNLWIFIIINIINMQSDGESGPASEDGSVCGATDTTVLCADNDISDPIEENF
jgi:hypothetical protein